MTSCVVPLAAVHSNAVERSGDADSMESPVGRLLRQVSQIVKLADGTQGMTRGPGEVICRAEKAPSRFVGDLAERRLPVLPPAARMLREYGAEMRVANQKCPAGADPQRLIDGQPRGVNGIDPRPALFRLGDHLLQHPRQVGARTPPAQGEAGRNKDNHLGISPRISRSRRRSEPSTAQFRYRRGNPRR